MDLVTRRSAPLCRTMASSAGSLRTRSILVPATTSTTPTTQARPSSSRRRLHSSARLRTPDAEPPRPMSLGRRLLQPLADKMSDVVPRVAEPYRIYGVTADLYKACANQADYTISEQARKDGTMEVREDGEEVGTGSTMWHREFGLPVTFSTWSQVTMLHLWLLTVRMRCFDKADYQTWQKQLTDHFFYGAETRMETTHAISSGSIRQRYLKDLFLQWRGALLSYDHGLVTDDATLASAVWRNIFSAREDIDVRYLAAIVSWLRLCLRQLGEMSDDEFLGRGALVFKNRAAWELLVVDQPVPDMVTLLKKDPEVAV